MAIQSIRNSDSLILADKLALLQHRNRDMHAVRAANLFQDVLDVRLDRGHRDIKLLRDFIIVQSLRNQLRHLVFARTQIRQDERLLRLGMRNRQQVLQRFRAKQLLALLMPQAPWPSAETPSLPRARNRR